MQLINNHWIKTNKGSGKNRSKRKRKSTGVEMCHELVSVPPYAKKFHDKMLEKSRNLARCNVHVLTICASVGGVT